MVQKDSLDKIIVICGPTASGKTALSVSVARAIKSEVISADSMNIYRGLNIGTAKPSFEEMQGVKHHLIDICNKTDNFTVEDYRENAKPIVDNLIKNNKIPVICGGTGFYINSLIYDLSYGNGKENPLVRKKYFDLASKYGNEYVYNLLKEVDIESANKLHFNDLKRVIRALEIYENGVKKSDIKDNFTKNYDVKAFQIDFDRDILYNRIETRVDKMIENGLIDEVKGLINSGITIKNQCMQGIGYKEIYSYLMGDISIEQAISDIKINTRHYAKRQITFFKKLNPILLKPDNLENLTKEVLKYL